jgi:hypothetical protein
VTRRATPRWMTDKRTMTYRRPLSPLGHIEIDICEDLNPRHHDGDQTPWYVARMRASTPWLQEERYERYACPVKTYEASERWLARVEAEMVEGPLTA